MKEKLNDKIDYKQSLKELIEIEKKSKTFKDTVFSEIYLKQLERRLRIYEKAEKHSGSKFIEIINKLLAEGLNGRRYNFMINGEELKEKVKKEFNIDSQQIKKDDNLMGKSSGDTKIGGGSNNHLKDLQSDNQSADNLFINQKNQENHSQQKKDRDDGSNVSLSGDTKHEQGKTIEDEHMPVESTALLNNADNHADPLCGNYKESELPETICPLGKTKEDFANQEENEVKDEQI